MPLIAYAAKFSESITDMLGDGGLVDMETVGNLFLAVTLEVMQG